MKAAGGYSWLDRALHRLAFATPTAQWGLADLEARWFARELDAVPDSAPIYVAGLPRAGSTMLHRLLAACPSLATHRLRDMPFVVCPLLWRPFARRFERAAVPRERAHGDGIAVGPDSPEALDEVLWAAERSSGAAEFAAMYARHRRKVVALERRDRPQARRYLAKNNALIERLARLGEVAPDALVVVPFRSASAQAASLLRQHLRFCELQSRDPFARRYMQATGHREFGLDHVPPTLPGVVAPRDAEALRSPTYWLDLWLAVYRALLAATPAVRMVFVDFERQAREQNLDALAEALSLPAADREVLRAAAATALRPLTAEAASTVGAEWQAVEAELRARADRR